VSRNHEYTLTTKVGKWEVHISPSTNYGFFEHIELGEGGGLWFKGGALVDYDGVFELPSGVEAAIQELGYRLEGGE